MDLALAKSSANGSIGAFGAAELAAAIVDSSFDAIVSQTLDGRVTGWNPAATALFGYRPEDMIGASIRRLIPGDRQGEEDRILAKIKAGEPVGSYVTVRLDKERRPIDVFLTISPIWDRNRKIIGASKIYRNIASHKEDLEALRWRQFVEQAPVAMLVLDRKMIHLACSRRWIDLHGGAGIGRYHYDLFPQVPEHWKEAHRRGLAGETVSADEELFERPDGGQQWFRWEVRPWLMSDGAVGGITIMTENVTDRVLAVRALRQNELRMRLGQEAAKAGSWEWKRSGRTSVWSENLWKLFGLAPHQNEPTGKLWLSTIHPDDREHVKAEIKRAAAAGQTFEVQWRANRPEGEHERWLFARGRPLTGGDSDRYFGVVIDITEQKLMEKALRESEMRMRLAQEAAGAGTWEWRIADNSIESPDPLWKLYGLQKPSEWQPSFEGWKSLIHPADRERVVDVVQKAIVLGQDYEAQWRLNLPEGEPERWLLSRGKPMANENGVISRYFGVVIEITQQKLMEQALRDSEMRMRLAQEAARAGAWEWTLADNRLQWSESLWRLYGLEKPERWDFTIEAWMQYVHPDDRERIRATVLVAASRGEDYEIQWRSNPAHGGRERWFLARGRSILDKKGSPERYFGVVIEITEQRLADNALRESEMRMRLAQEGAKAGAFEWRLADNYLEWPDSMWALYDLEKPEGWTPSIEGWAPLIHPADRERTAAAVLGAAAAGRSYEVQWRLNVQDGEPERWFLCRGKPLANSSGSPDRYFGVVMDITEQKLAENALRESEVRMRLAQEAARTGAWEWNLANNNVQWSQSLWNLYGVQKPERWQPNFESWRELVHPADRDRVTAEVWQATAHGQDLEVQWRLNLPQGEPERWFLSRGRPITEANGSPDRYFGVIIEITEQKRMEEASRENEERQSFLLALNDAIRSTGDPDEVTAVACKMLGQMLGASQVSYAEMDEEGKKACISRCWNDGTVPSAAATYNLDEFDASSCDVLRGRRTFFDVLRSGRTVSVGDVRTGPRTWSRAALTLFKRNSIAAFIAVPLLKDRRLAGFLWVKRSDPHPWRKDEVALAEQVAERTWEAVERARVSEALRVSEERQSFLLALNDALRTVDDPFETIAIASERLGQRLDAGQVVYVKAGDTGRPSITHEWNDGVASGAFAIEAIDDCAPSLVADLANGRVVIVNDVRLDSRTHTREALALFERGSVAAIIIVPFIKNGRLAGGMGVHKRAPHAWTTEEISLAREVAERTWDAVERASSSQALRVSEERQSFLLALNDALRAVDDPFETIAVASGMLGRKLNATQVVYAKCDETAEYASITHDWNDGVARGAFVVNRLSDFNAPLIEDLKCGRTVAVSDVRTDPRSCSPEALKIFARASVAAIIAVPFVKNQRLAGVLAVHMSETHPWTKDEVALAQEVAERTWEAVERARVSQALRESEMRLKFALTAGDAGTWELALDTGDVLASHHALTLLNLPPDAHVTLETFLAQVHPDDRPLFQQAVLHALQTGETYPLEWRTQLPDGSFRWLETRGEVRSVLGKQVISGLIQDITKKVEQKEAVERAAKAKSEFLSNMSHELRTPMHAILSYSDMGQIVLAEQQTDAVKEYLSNIKTAGTRLLGLLNDLLDLAKMQAGKMIYKRANANFGDVVCYALMEIKPLLAQKGIEAKVRQEARDGSAWVHIDKSRLIQVLVNLLSNAIKFSGAGKNISISTSSRLADDGVEVLRCRIADEGPGIPEGELQTVFDKFVQSSKTKTGAGGTGLGLAICREIVEAHGGTIWAENIEPHGAAFLFDIPLVTAGEDHVVRP